MNHKNHGVYPVPDGKWKCLQCQCEVKEGSMTPEELETWMREHGLCKRCGVQATTLHGCDFCGDGLYTC